MNSRKSFRGDSSSHSHSYRLHNYRGPRFGFSYQNQSEISRCKQYFRNPYPISNIRSMIPYSYTSFHNNVPHRQKLIYPKDIQNQQFIPFGQKNMEDNTQNSTECNHNQTTTVRSDEKLNMTIDTVKRKLEEHKLNEVFSKYNNAHLSETEEENCKLSKTTGKKRIEHSKMSPKIDVSKKNEKKDNTDKNKQAAPSDNVYQKKSQILRKSILQQLFRLNSNNLRQVVNLPESSKKYNFAITSLLQDRRNALSKELRIVAEKSLKLHNVPADSAQGEKIFQDAFLGHLGTMLDANASIELMNMEPQVIKELSKVLQDDLMDSTNENLSVQNLASFIDQDLSEVFSEYDYFDSIQCKIEPLSSNILEMNNECDDRYNDDCYQEHINKINSSTSLSAEPELFSRIKAEINAEDYINIHIPLDINTETSHRDESAVSYSNETEHEDLFDKNDRLKNTSTENCIYDDNLPDHTSKLSILNTVNQIKNEEMEPCLNKNDNFFTFIDNLVNKDVNRKCGDFVDQNITIKRTKLEKEILPDLKSSDIQNIASNQVMSNISLNLNMNQNDLEQCGSQNDLIDDTCTFKRFIKSKNVLEESFHTNDKITSEINSNKSQNCVRKKYTNDQSIQCCNLESPNSLSQLSAYSVDADCCRPNITCSYSQTINSETVNVGCQTEINFDSYIDFLCSNQKIFNDMDNLKTNKSSEIFDKMKVIDRYIQVLLRNKFSLYRIFESMNNENNDVSACNIKSSSMKFNQTDVPKNKNISTEVSADNHVGDCKSTENKPKRKRRKRKRKSNKKKNLCDEKNVNDSEKKTIFNNGSSKCDVEMCEMNQKELNQPKGIDDVFTIRNVYSLGKSGELCLHKNLVDIEIPFIDKSEEISTQIVSPKFNKAKNITIEDKIKETMTNSILNLGNSAKKVKYKKKKPYKYKNVTKLQVKNSNKITSRKRAMISSDIIEKLESKIVSLNKHTDLRECFVVIENIDNKTFRGKSVTHSSLTIPHCISSNNINTSEKAKSTSSNNFFAHFKDVCTSTSKCGLKSNDSETQKSNVSLENANYLVTSRHSNEKNTNNEFINNTQDSHYNEDLKIQKVYPSLGENMFKFDHKDSIISMKCVKKNILAVSKDGYVYYFCEHSGSLLQIFKAAVLTITCFHVDIKNKTIYCGSVNSNLTCFNYETGISLIKPISIGSPIRSLCCAWSTIYIGTQTGFVIQYNIETNSVMSDKTSQFSTEAILALEAIKEGPRKVLLVASRSQDITVNDANSGLLLRTFQSPDSIINDLYFNSGSVFCITNGADIQVFDFATGSIVGLHTCGKSTKCLQIYKGLIFAACYNGLIYIFKPGIQKPFANIAESGKMLLTMMITNDTIITSFQNNVLLVRKIPENVLNEMTHN